MLQRVYKREKEKQVCFWPLPRDSATGAAIALLKILISILSVSKRNCAQPPLSHIKPISITFGNELRTYDNYDPLLESDSQYVDL